MKKIAICCTIIAAFLLAPGGVAKAQEQSGGRARLCQIATIETLMPRTADDLCPSPYYENEGALCVAATEGHNVFSYIIKDDKSLDFGLSYSFVSGHHCGIIGNAKETDDGWRYERGMDSKNPEERCGLTIRMDKDNLIFDADPDASCRVQCGAQAYLTGVVMPLSAIESTPVTQDSFRPEIFFNTPCQSKKR